MHVALCYVFHWYRGEVVRIYTKKQRCQYTPLGYTADNRKRLRKGEVDLDNLLPDTQIATKLLCT